jgi:hypothetical protein
MRNLRNTAYLKGEYIMTTQPNTQEKMTTIPSKELRTLRAEIKRLQHELDKERRGSAMLLYLMGGGRDCGDEKNRLLIILQEKVNQAIMMLGNSTDSMDVLKMLTEKADFFETHPTFLLGMNEWKQMYGSDKDAETVMTK